MKKYVFDFASDIINQDAENPLMLDSAKRERANKILNIIDLYIDGFCSASEAVRMIADSVL